MARSPQATAKQFVREATIGLVVVAVLLAFLGHAIVRRFGLWQSESQPQDVVAARVYARLPKPGEPVIDANRDPVRVPAPVAQAPRSTAPRSPAPQAPRSTSPQAVPVADPSEPAEVRVATQPSDNPRSMSAPFSTTGSGTQTDSTSGTRSNSTAVPGATLPPAASPRPVSTSGGSFPVTSPGSSSSSATGETNGMRSSRPNSESGEPRNESSQGSPGSVFRSVAFEPRDERGSVRQVAGTFPVREANSQVDTRWVVKLEDSSFTYCERNYGDPQWFRALEAWLRKEGTSFDELPRGIPLTPPSLVALAQTAPELVPRSYRDSNDESQPPAPGTYITSGSENLFDIAARVYGQAGRYVELLELNRGTSIATRDPLEPLPAGTRVQIPMSR